MPATIDILSLVLIVLLAAGLAVAVMSAAKPRKQARKDEERSKAICAAITEYFRKSGVVVDVNATRLGASKRFTAIVESEPMKRFRLSHIIEMTLREHVRRTCNLELDKVYWRFPIKEAGNVAASAQADVPAPASTEQGADDEYINEGLEHYKYIPKMEATELSWEHFQELSTQTKVPADEGGKDKPVS
jgi:hypothetical protein